MATYNIQINNPELRERLETLIDELNEVENRINNIVKNIEAEKVQEKDNGFRYIVSGKIDEVGEIDMGNYKMIETANTIAAPNYVYNDPFFMEVEDSIYGGVFGLKYIPTSHFTFSFLPNTTGKYKMLFVVTSHTDFTYYVDVKEQNKTASIVSLTISNQNEKGINWIYVEFDVTKTDTPIAITLNTDKVVALNYFNVYPVESEKVNIFTYGMKKLSHFYVFGPRVIVLFENDLNSYDRIGIKYTKGNETVYHYRGFDFYVNHIKMNTMKAVVKRMKTRGAVKPVNAPRTIISEGK